MTLQPLSPTQTTAALCVHCGPIFTDRPVPQGIDPVIQSCEWCELSLKGIRPAKIPKHTCITCKFVARGPLEMVLPFVSDWAWLCEVNAPPPGTKINPTRPWMCSKWRPMTKEKASG